MIKFLSEQNEKKLYKHTKSYDSFLKTVFQNRRLNAESMLFSIYSRNQYTTAECKYSHIHVGAS